MKNQPIVKKISKSIKILPKLQLRKISSLVPSFKNKKAGLPPGEVVFIGEKKLETSKISKIEYNINSVNSELIVNWEDINKNKQDNSIQWYNIDGLHETKLIEHFGKKFNLHPLIQEDIANTTQRPKVEEYDDMLFTVIKDVTFNDKTKLISIEQISFVLGKNYLLSFQEEEGDCYDIVRERIINNKGKIRGMKSDYLLYRLLDATVDKYFNTLEVVGDFIGELEAEILENANKVSLSHIHQLKRELIILRKHLWPLREVVNKLVRDEHPLISKEIRIYFRDIYDHTIQVIDTLETYRDMVSTLEELYLSILSNKMNEVMKVLTIIATLFIPLTFIAGVYGMNFEFMPELKWKYSYPVLWGIMISIILGMIYYFKKRKWF